MKKKMLILVFIIVVMVIVTVGITYSGRVSTKEFKTDSFKVSYDSTWKVKKKNDELMLVHKKTKSVLDIQYKLLEDNYMNTSLNDIISDIIYGVEKQNKDYKLINMMDSPSDKYESYSYLYEKNSEQVLVNIYKKDNVLVIAYYQAESRYYDIVLDSVDTILNSLEIFTGIEVK